jgi:oligopeptidase B
VILDEPKEAGSKEYFRVGTQVVSPDGRTLAYSIDDSGAERYTIRFRCLSDGAPIADSIAGASGKWGDESIEGTIGNIVFSADGTCILYGLTDEHWRTRTIKLHVMGTDTADDPTIYYEEDASFSVGVSVTTDRRWITLVSGNHDTSEVRLVPIENLLAEPILISPRQEKREYSVDSAHGKLWILTNDDHVNFRVAVADPTVPGDWETVIAGSDQVYLRGISSFAQHLMITERVDGLDQIRLRGYDGAEHRIAFPEASYTASLGSNPEYDPAAYRIGYASMVTPQTVFDYDPASRALTTLKVQEIPSGYDPSLYATERLMVPARDGKSIPVSVLYRRGFPRDGSGKLFLYAYGAYGHAIPPGFSTVRLSMVDRGWAYAIAHIRGGDDLGYDWYLQGKAEARWNTFRDFSDAARGLLDAGFSKPGNIAINGGSAGGELMGVVANTDPDLWGAVVADVPFVDVLNTMQDESLPLTPGEWPEWGNPITDPKAFDLIRSYSPYDNVAAKAYPPMLITGGLNDPRVTYWEPAKWAAALRHAKTDDNLLLLKINMGAGHGGKSGRYDSLKEDAEAFAFVLTQIAD